MLKYLFAKPVASGSNLRYLDTPKDADVFTYNHKHAGQALLGALVFAAIIEAAALHLLLSMWNHWIAVAATVSSLWFGLQVIAQIRAIGMRPIYIEQGCITLRNGAFDLAKIPISKILSFEKTTAEIKPEKSAIPPLNAGFPATHNVVLKLREPLEATILNRKKREFQVAYLAIDDADRFIATVGQQQ